MGGGKIEGVRGTEEDHRRGCEGDATALPSLHATAAAARIGEASATAAAYAIAATAASVDVAANAAGNETNIAADTAAADTADTIGIDGANPLSAAQTTTTAPSASATHGVRECATARDLCICRGCA